MTTEGAVEKGAPLAPGSVRMYCLSRKLKFDVVDPDIVKMANGRPQYRTTCPWMHAKSGRSLVACKFASTEAYKDKLLRDAERQEISDDSDDSV